MSNVCGRDSADIQDTVTSERVAGPGAKRRPSETYVYTCVIGVLSVISALNLNPERRLECSQAVTP